MIGKMLLPLVLTLLMMNSMFLFMTTLPSDVQLINTYGTSVAFMGQDEIASLSTGIVDDVETLRDIAGQQVADASASDEPSLIPEPFKTLLYGASVVVSGVETIFGLGTFFIKWLFLGVFGFIIWVDWLLPPQLGTGIIYIAGAIKAFLGIIVVKGLADIILPLFTGWRGN